MKEYLYFTKDLLAPPRRYVADRMEMSQGIVKLVNETYDIIAVIAILPGESIIEASKQR
jgi:hypothetical protein